MASSSPLLAVPWDITISQGPFLAAIGVVFWERVWTVVRIACFCTLAALLTIWADARTQTYGASAGGAKEGAPEATNLGPGAFFGVLAGGKIKLDTRYRYENVDDDGLDREAHAHVLRTRLGYLTGRFVGFQVFAEMENLAHVSDDKFNDTVNAKRTRPVVADPDITEVNQAYLDYADGPFPDFKFRGGRFRWKIDNDRFIGNVGFRQNEQTFDGLWVKNVSLPKTEITYGYLSNVNRITGNDNNTNGDFRMNSHVAHLKYTRFPFAQFSLYNYHLDYDERGTVRQNSTNSTGARVWGKYSIEAAGDLTLIYAFEFAHQKDIGNNPLNITEEYYHLNPGVKWGGWTAKVGYEVLGGDGTAGFRTPLATLHAFNGETDSFLGTPPRGLEDIYAKVSYEFRQGGFLDDFTVWAMYHEFETEEGSTDLGDEFSFAVSKRFNDVVPEIGGKAWIEFRYAAFDSGKNDPQNRRDVDKLWVTLRYNY